MQTLGDVVTWGLALAALIIVPYKIAKAWIWPLVRPSIMSRLSITRGADQAVADPGWATATHAPQLIAAPDNAGNAELSGNGVAAFVPTEARDIIRMQAKAEAVAALLKSAKMTNKAEAIELIFGCSRSGRPNSMYQQALTLVDPLIEKYPQRTEEQERQRQSLNLTPR